MCWKAKYVLQVNGGKFPNSPISLNTHNSWAVRWNHILWWICSVFVSIWYCWFYQFYQHGVICQWAIIPAGSALRATINFANAVRILSISILMRHSCVSFYIKSIFMLNLLLLCLNWSNRLKKKLTRKQKIIFFCNVFYNLSFIIPKVIYKVVYPIHHQWGTTKWSDSVYKQK